ncbi:MAG: SPOR domain-containing protein [Pseudomonas sp.]|nr:SPOR domain-containing protein [Pseudomonas sp.]
MRWSFLLLLVLNLFYYVWHQQQAPLRAKEILPLSLYRGAQQDIQLVSEAERPQARTESEGVQAEANAACLFLGGLEEESVARAVEQRLLSTDIKATVEVLDAAVGLDYWVYLAPLASRQASLRQLKELQARKIDSYIISQGDLVNGISLGIFPRSDSAQSVMQRLREAGYEPMLRELARAHRNYWVKISSESRLLVSDALLSRLAEDFLGLEHRLMPCEGIATPR